MVQAKGLDYGPNFFEGIDNLFAIAIESREPSRELATVLQVKQHARHELSSTQPLFLGKE
jgi:hypothetical protein